MKIVIASDSFKGSLSSIEISNIIEKVAKNIFSECSLVKIPMADGGEGTVESLINVMNGEKVTCTVKDPLLRDIKANYGIFGDTAIMEMAEASGITLVKENERDILSHSTFGTGQMLLNAVESGYTNIYIGIGGSATNDCGIGFASAIGVKFFDENMEEVTALPKNFKKIKNVDISGINPKILSANITVLSDVSNPLLGEFGATNVFGKQKGADSQTRKILESGIAEYISIAEKNLGKSVANQKGAGAAGGLGSAFMLYTNAKISSGVDSVLKILRFKDKIYDADLVITGEGRMDYQSAFGKVASGVGKVCKENNIPCIAIVGSVGERAEEMYNYGIRSIIPTVDGIMSLDYAIENAHELYESAAIRALELVKIGMEYNSLH